MAGLIDNFGRRRERRATSTKSARGCVSFALGQPKRRPICGDVTLCKSAHTVCEASLPLPLRSTATPTIRPSSFQVAEELSLVPGRRQQEMIRTRTSGRASERVAEVGQE